MRWAAVLTSQVKCRTTAVAEGAGDEEGVPEVLAPEVLGDLGGHDVAHVQGEPRVELLLEHDEGVLVAGRRSRGRGRP